jgi:signal transduction histidine kinase
VAAYAEGMGSGPGHRFAAMISAGVTDPPAPRAAWLRRGPVDLVFLADLITTIICFGISASWLETENRQSGSHFGTGTLLLFAAAVSAPLLLRIRWPALAWAASAAAVVGTTEATGGRAFSSAVYVPAGVLVYGLCLYAVAVRCRAWFVIAVAAATAVGAIAIDAQSGAGSILAAIPLLFGVIVRSRRSSRTELAQQARRLEGERALLEERQRIARELHDIVAHHMSVIAIQAEAARRKVPDPPPELAESFAEIRASALTGLDELRRLLGVLRSGGADTAPQPGLDELPGLLESARSGGVQVTSSVSGATRELPPGVDLSAYRILQEALSNAMRHAPGSAVRVELAYAPTSLVLKVRNGAGPPGVTPTVRHPRPAGSGPVGGGPEAGGPDGTGNGSGHGTGQGLIGMRERAAMLGGHLEAGPTREGGFLVTAVLPDHAGQPERRR